MPEKLKTKLGLPLLRQETYDTFMNEVRSFGNYETGMQFVRDLLAKIWRNDPLYGKFVSDTANMWPITERDMALSDLVTGYELLSREGELPLLDEVKFRKRWEATMNRAVAMLNVGINMPVIERDNHFFGKFILESTRPYPQPQRIYLLSDLSSGYMFLVDNVKR